MAHGCFVLEKPTAVTCSELVPVVALPGQEGVALQDGQTTLPKVAAVCVDDVDKLGVLLVQSAAGQGELKGGQGRVQTRYSWNLPVAELLDLLPDEPDHMGP